MLLRCFLRRQRKKRRAARRRAATGTATAGAMVEAETELFCEGEEEDVEAGSAMLLEWVARDVEALPSD